MNSGALKSLAVTGVNVSVTPAKAGVQSSQELIDSGIRRNDDREILITWVTSPVNGFNQCLASFGLLFLPLNMVFHNRPRSISNGSIGQANLIV